MFWGKKSFRKVKLFHYFRSLTAKNFGFSAKIRHQVSQKGILRVLGNFLSNCLGEKNIYLFTVFQILSKKIRTLGKESSRFIKTGFNESRRIFSGFFEKIHPLHNFYILSIKQINFCLKDFGRVFKLLQLRKNNLEKPFFGKFISIYFVFQTLSETF